MDDFEPRKSSGDTARLLLMIVLCAGIFIAWSWWTRTPPDASSTTDAGRTDSSKTKTPDAKAADTKTPDTKTPAVKEVKAFTVRPPKTAPPATAALGAAETPDGLLSIEQYRYRVQFRPGTGSVTEVRLAEFLDRLPAAIDFTDRRSRPMPLLNPAGKTGAEFESFRIVHLAVDDKVVDLGTADWEVPASTDAGAAAGEIVFRLTVVDGEGREALQIDKVFSVRERDGVADAPHDGPGHLMTAAFRVRSTDGKKHKVVFDFLGPLGVPEDHTQDIPKIVWGVRHEAGRDTKEKSIGYDELIRKHEAKEKLPAVAEKKDAAAVTWYVGGMNRFFAALLLPDRLRGASRGKEPGPCEIESVEVRHFDQPVEPISERSPSHAFAPVVRVAQEVSGTFEAKYHVYLGPKKDALFREVSAFLGADFYLDKLIQYASGCCFMDWCSGPIGTFIGYPLLWLMEQIATVMPGRNYGVAIIIVVLLVRVLVYPISRKSTMSMLRMKELQPKIAELQAKYAGNREELGRRQMELYQKEGVNPLGGCLPMLLQMPVWIGLWGALSAAVNLRHQPFVFWIKDLAGDDALIRFAGRLSIPLGCFDLPLPNVVNVLPLLMVAVMFIQQRSMTPAQTDPNQPNPKIMMYMMTGMFLFMLYSAPAGLNLYIMTSTLAGLLEQWWVKRHYEDLKARGLLAPTNAKPGWFGRLIARIREIQEEQERLRSGKSDKGGERDRGDRKKKR